MASKSRHVCRRCGLAVYLWRGEDTWKHAAGGNAKSCGKPPIVVTRAAHEAELAEATAGAMAAMRRFLDAV